MKFYEAPSLEVLRLMAEEVVTLLSGDDNPPDPSEDWTPPEF